MARASFRFGLRVEEPIIPVSWVPAVSNVLVTANLSTPEAEGSTSVHNLVRRTWPLGEDGGAELLLEVTITPFFIWESE